MRAARHAVDLTLPGPVATVGDWCDETTRVDPPPESHRGVPMREEIRKIQGLMEGAHYITDPAIATAVHLATTLQKPLLVEGHAGVGKTEIAKVLARVLDTNLIRLQCYEGLDAATALYEWNYPKQLLRIKLEEREHGDKETVETEIFTQDYLIKRPLLEAIQTDGAGPPVLLIDEIDRADMEVEAL